MTDESTNAAAAMPPYAKREPKRREFHGDVFDDDYEWMRDKDSDDVRSYVAAENQYCERRMAHLADFRHTLFEELKSHVEETDMSVPTRINDYWYFTRTQQGKQYGVQCRIPVRDADDWDPPVVDPQGAPGSMPGEQVVFDANKESEGHDFFRLGGLDLSKDGRWMLYGVDVAGDERYDFRIRDLAGLETGEPVSELPRTVHRHWQRMLHAGRPMGVLAGIGRFLAAARRVAASCWHGGRIGCVRVPRNR